MTHTRKDRNSPQRQARKTERKEGELGQPREPQGDPAHFDKHGGKLDHEGKPAQQQPRQSAQEQHDPGDRLPRRPPGLPPGGIEERERPSRH